MRTKIDTEALISKIETLNQGRVLCIGDLMLDDFIYGSVDRISPEAPVPILKINHSELMLGGAGNVVRNMVSLGANACFISVVGDDQNGRTLTSLVGKEENIEAYLQVQKGRISSKKTRYIAGNQQLLRADDETVEKINQQTEDKIKQIALKEIPDCDVVVLSDYAKGVLTKDLISAVIKEAKKQKKPVIVDPKSKDFSIYHGATLVTPNLAELRAAVNKSISGEKEITEAAKKLIEGFGFNAVLVTRGKNGMSLVTKNGKHQHFPAEKHEIYDVSGAGDSVVATLAVTLAAGLDLEESAYLSNLAGGIAVSRIGTSIIHRTDLKNSLFTHNLTEGTQKILPQSEAFKQARIWRESGQKIGFTNGCFDLIHPGHVSLLSQAKSHCDKLIVGLNSDESVKRLKGEGRPVQGETSRAMVLASLSSVDMVIIFREDTPLKLIESVKPNVLVKGEDYKVEQVVGADFVKKNGGKVVLAKFSSGQSTTAMIKRMNAK